MPNKTSITFTKEAIVIAAILSLMQNRSHQIDTSRVLRTIVQFFGYTLVRVP